MKKSGSYIRCNRQTYSPTRDYTHGYKSAMKIVAITHPGYVTATTNIADVYPGCKYASHDVNARIKLPVIYLRVGIFFAQHKHT